MDLFAWWNLIFVLPFGTALVFLVLQAVGAMHLHDGHDVHADHDADAVHHDLSVFDKALSLLGVGRVPLSLLLTSFALLWGFLGWASNTILQPLLGSPALFIVPSIAIALVGSALLTRGFASAMSRIMPATETYATSKRELLGREGVAASEISASFGRVRVKDEYGNLQEVSCRVKAGEQPIPDGAKVVLMSFDDDADSYLASSDLIRELENSETSDDLLLRAAGARQEQRER